MCLPLSFTPSFRDTTLLRDILRFLTKGSHDIVIKRASSFSIDLPNWDLNMIELWGDQAHEMNQIRRNIDFGETRYIRHHTVHLNPLISLVSEAQQGTHRTCTILSSPLYHPTTNENSGEAWGFSLVYSGSFAATVSRFSHGFVRVLLGMNPLHKRLGLKNRAKKFTSPEAVGCLLFAWLGKHVSLVSRPLPPIISRDPFTRFVHGQFY